MICKSRRRMKCRTCLACTIALCLMTVGLTGCSDRKVSDKPAINIEPYAMTVHERATVKAYSEAGWFFQQGLFGKAGRF